MTVVWAFIGFTLLVAGGAAFVVTSASKAHKAEIKALDASANLEVVSNHLTLGKIQNEIRSEIDADVAAVTGNLYSLLS